MSRYRGTVEQARIDLRRRGRAARHAEATGTHPRPAARGLPRGLAVECPDAAGATLRAGTRVRSTLSHRAGVTGVVTGLLDEDTCTVAWPGFRELNHPAGDLLSEGETR